MLFRSRDAQMRSMLVNELTVDPNHLQPVLHYDGTPITARFIADAVRKRVSRVHAVSHKEAA